MNPWSTHDFRQIPFDRIARVGQRTLLHSDLFTVSWLLGRFCNYRCSYCWPYARADKKDHRPLELLVKTLDEIKRQARARGFNSFHFSFSGGEPSLHPGYLALLEHYTADLPQSHYQSCHMTTNLSPGVGWFKKYLQATAGLHRVSVTASFHKEFAERERFADKLIFLQENDVQVTINMVMVPERFAELWEDALYFHERQINVTLKPQSDPTASQVVSGYTPEQLSKLHTGMPQQNYTRLRMQRLQRMSVRPRSSLNLPAPTHLPPLANMQVELTDEGGEAWYMDQAERFNAFNFNRFQGWECSSGFRSIIIREPDGSVKRSYSCKDLPLGNIESGFELFPKLQPCITPTCVSSADSKIPKRRPGCELPLWKAPEVTHAP